LEKLEKKSVKKIKTIILKKITLTFFKKFYEFKVVKQKKLKKKILRLWSRKRKKKKYLQR